MSLNAGLRVRSDASFNGNLFINGTIVNTALTTSLGLKANLVAPSFTGGINVNGNASVYGNPYFNGFQLGADLPCTSIAMSESGQYQSIKVSASGGDIFRSIDYGETFTYLSGINAGAGADGSAGIITMSYSGQYQYASGDASFGRSINYGLTFSNVVLPVLWPIVQGRPTIIHASSSTGQYVTVTGRHSTATSTIYIFYSSNYGASFSTVTLTNTGGVHPTNITMTPDGQTQYIVISNSGNVPPGKIYRSTNFGASWTLIFTDTFNINYNFGNMSISTNGQYITFSNGGEIISSSNSGSTWTRMTVNNYGLNMSKDGSYRTYLFGYGLYESFDYGATFTLSTLFNDSQTEANQTKGQPSGIAFTDNAKTGAINSYMTICVNGNRNTYPAGVPIYTRGFTDTNSRVYGNLNVTQHLTVRKSLVVSGDISLNSSLRVNGNVFIQQNEYAAMTQTQLGYTLTVAGTAGNTTNNVWKTLNTISVPSKGVWLFVGLFELNITGGTPNTIQQIRCGLSSVAPTSFTRVSNIEYHREIDDAVQLVDIRDRIQVTGVFTTTAAATYYFVGRVNFTGFSDANLPTKGDSTLTRIG